MVQYSINKSNSNTKFIVFFLRKNFHTYIVFYITIINDPMAEKLLIIFDSFFSALVIYTFFFFLIIFLDKWEIDEIKFVDYGGHYLLLCFGFVGDMLP